MAVHQWRVPTPEKPMSKQRLVKLIKPFVYVCGNGVVAAVLTWLLYRFAGNGFL